MNKALLTAALAVAGMTAGSTAYAQMNSMGHGDQRGQGAMNAQMDHHSMSRHHSHCRTMWRHHHRVRVCR